MDNGGKGDCGFASVMQLRAIIEGHHPHVVEDAFLRENPLLYSRRARLFAAARELTVKEFLASDKQLGLDRPRAANTLDEIRRLALDYNKAISNAEDFVNVVRYIHENGGGHADDRALRNFAKALDIPNLELVREAVVQDETLLVEVDGESTALAGVSMVLWEPGHWRAIASNVSLSCTRNPNPKMLISSMKPLFLCVDSKLSLYFLCFDRRSRDPTGAGRRECCCFSRSSSTRSLLKAREMTPRCVCL